jgi:hypothetical protein
VNKKSLFLLVLLSTLLITGVAGTQIIKKVEAWPPYEPDYESLLAISVSSPENNRLYNADTLKLNFSVTAGKNTNSSLISNVCYKIDWQEENRTVFSFDGYFLRELMYQLLSPRQITVLPTTRFSTSLNITEVPDGNHSITIYASMWHYSSMERRIDVFEEYFDYDDLKMASIEKTVAFTIDTTPPVISILSTGDKYDTSDVFLNFTVNELVSQITYSLDGQDKVSIPENTTLTELSNGDHNVTIYATDLAGNTGSETMYFSVEIPFPIALVLTSVIITVVVVFAVFLLLRKQRQSKT